MDSRHTKDWIWFSDRIKDDLDNRPLLSITAFTPHNFSNHCYNIYKIISLLLEKQLYHAAYDELSSESLYILNISVLFHDYSMSQANCDDYRFEHSYKSAELFGTLYESWKKCDIADLPELTSGQIKMIQAIVKAHSDKKESSEGITKILVNSLDEIEREDEPASTAGKRIYVKYLAGLLRLADELDVTHDRAGNEFRKVMQLDSTIKEQRKSIEYWKKLLYFYQMDIENGAFRLYVDNDIASEDTATARRIVQETTNHANKEFDMIKEKCFKNRMHLLSFNRIISFNPETNEPYIKTFSTDILDNTTAIIVNTEEVKQKSNFNITRFSSVLSNELEQLIVRNNYIICGHFNLNNSLCSRDWIDTKKIINEKKLKKKICDEMSADFSIQGFKSTDTLLVGISTLGSILASYIAHDLNFPFSYIIPDKDKDEHSMQDKQFTAKTYKNVILFTDVIASFETIKRAITDNRIISKTKLVYSVFYRPITHPDIDNISDFLRETKQKYRNIKIRTINDRIPITVFKKEKCQVLELARKCGEEYQCLDNNKLEVDYAFNKTRV